MIPIKNPNVIIHRMAQNPKIHMGIKDSEMLKQSSTKKSNTGGITIPDFKLCYRAHSNKNSMVLAQKQTQRLIRIEDLELNPHSYRYLTFDKGSKNTCGRKDNLFNK
jgi:hypothetical protein